MTPLRFVSWAAVSSLPQAKKVSNEDQLRTNREHITRHGGQLVTELVVPGESRSIILFEEACRRIEAYAQLRDLIDQRSFDVLIYLDRSRLGRKAPLSMAVVELCHEAGIVTYEIENPPTTLDKPHTSHDDQLLGAIKSVGAQREVEKLTERHKMGMLGRLKRGEVANKIVYGYVAHFDASGNRQIVIDQPAATVVCQIFAWYLAGDGTPAIAEKLNAQGTSSPLGRRWQPVNVRNILDNAVRYAGYAEANRYSERDRPYMRAKGTWQAIIEESTLEKFEAERRSRKENRHLANTPYLLSGLVWCVKCNRPMHVHTNASQRAGKPRVMQMQCRGRHSARALSYRRILATLRMRMEALAGADLDELATEDNQAELLLAQVVQHEATIEKAHAALLRVDDAYVAGTMDHERWRRQAEKLQAQKLAAQSEIDRLQKLALRERERGSRRQRLHETVEYGLTMLDNPDVAAANIWLRNHVRVWTNEYEVTAVEWI